VVFFARKISGKISIIMLARILLKWHLRYRHFATILLCLSVGACFLPRSTAPLQEDSRPETAVAILPVDPEQVRIILRTDAASTGSVSLGESGIKNRERVAQVCNAVLDTLASGEGSRIMGPTKTKEALARAPGGERTKVFLDDPGPLDEAWKKDGLKDLSKILGLTRIIRAWPTVEGKMESGGGLGFLGSSWSGRVVVKVELVNLAPPEISARGSGEGEYWGAVGAVGGYGGAVPFALGTTFGRAVDQATRGAMTQIFPSKTVPEVLK
jgi:hypothetical protein